MIFVINHRFSRSTVNILGLEEFIHHGRRCTKSMPLCLDTPSIHTAITRAGNQEVCAGMALRIKTILINLEDSFLHDLRTIVISHKELLISGVNKTGVRSNRSGYKSVLRVIRDYCGCSIIGFLPHITGSPRLVIFIIYIRIEVNSRQEELCRSFTDTVRLYTLCRKFNLQILQLFYQPLIEFMTRDIVRIFVGLRSNKRRIEEEVHEVEIVERTNPTYLCHTIFILICLCRTISQIVVAILDIEVQTGIDTFNHTAGTGPVGRRKTARLIIIPDPESLIRSQVVTIPDGTIETRHTGIHIFHIGVLTGA